MRDGSKTQPFLICLKFKCLKPPLQFFHNTFGVRTSIYLKKKKKRIET